MTKSLSFLSLLVIFLLAACTNTPGGQPTGYVDLSNLQPLPTQVEQNVTPLRVAVAAVISPQGTIDSYADFLNYLGEKTGRPVELIQRRTYLEINDLVKNGDVDVAFVCTSAYVDGHDQFGMELLAAPLVEGEAVYYSLLIVPADSPVRSMEELEGKVFAFTDPISLSGRMYPTHLVQQLGRIPENFFARTFFTYSHDDAIRAVANKLADGAAVDSLVYNFAVDREPEMGRLTRVIHQSPAFGIPPVVVSPMLRPQLKAELQTILLQMDQDPSGQKSLQNIGVDRFILIEDSAYNDVRTLLSDINQTR